MAVRNTSYFKFYFIFPLNHSWVEPGNQTLIQLLCDFRQVSFLGTLYTHKINNLSKSSFQIIERLSQSSGNLPDLKGEWTKPVSLSLAYSWRMKHLSTHKWLSIIFQSLHKGNARPERESDITWWVIITKTCSAGDTSLKKAVHFLKQRVHVMCEISSYMC
jgi:hypothetical protein